MSGVAPLPPAGSLPVRGLFPEDAVAPLAAAPSGPDFGAAVRAGLAQVNDTLLASQADLQALAAGDVQNVHQLMIRLEQSRMSFQLLLQVRGRLLEAYQDIMKMQI